jgi:hypothetical protein
MGSSRRSERQPVVWLFVDDAILEQWRTDACTHGDNPQSVIGV